MTIENNDRLLVNRGSTSHQIKYEKIKDDILGAADAAIEDAPDDGIMYGRRNKDWQQIVHNPYSNADVDAHLNTNLANGGQILSWDGSDYAWVADQTGSGGGGSSDASLISYQYPGGVSRSVESRLKDRVSVKDFGAKGDGSTDDTIALQAAFDSVGASGMTLYFPSGEYQVSSKLTINQSAPGLTIYLDGGAVIKASTSFPQNTKFIEAKVSSGTDKSFTWTGGIVDGTRMPTRTSGAPDLFTIQDANYSSVTFTNSQFIQNRADLSNTNNPPLIGTAGDSCMFLAKARNIYVSGCTFMGAMDAGIYISGDSSGDPKGENCIIGGNFFYYCRQVGLITKRAFKNQIFTNNITDYCWTGIATGSVTDSSDNKNPGLQCIITNNTIRNSPNSGINLRVSDHSIVSNNIVENPGILFNVNGTPQSWQQSASGIAIQGCVSVSVIGNVVFIDKSINREPNQRDYGIQLGKYFSPDEGTDVDSKFCMISSNSIARMWYGVADIFGSASDPDSMYNVINLNIYRGCAVTLENKHSRTFFQEVDGLDARVDIGFGNENLIQFFQPITNRRGEVILGNDTNDVDLDVRGFLTVKNTVTGTSINVQNMINNLQLAASDPYSDLQQFKNAIKQALEGLSND